MGEVKWLEAITSGLTERPDDQRRDYLRRYATDIVALTGVLNVAIDTRPIDPKAFEPVGLGILQVRAREHEARGL